MLPNNTDLLTDEEFDALLDETGELSDKLEEDDYNDDNTELTDDGDEVIAEVAPAVTYTLDMGTGELSHKIDEMPALKQYIVKALFTARDAHAIYSSDYASEIEELIMEQEDTEYTAFELERICREAIENDDRIIEVESVDITFEDDSIYAVINCNTVYGQLVEEVDVIAL